MTLFSRLSQALGSAVFFAGCVVPCVRFNCIVRLYIRAFSTVATLGMSGWLDLAQRGLSPHKKRQASFGALTPSFQPSQFNRCWSGSGGTARGLRLGWRRSLGHQPRGGTSAYPFKVALLPSFLLPLCVSLTP